MSKDLDKKLHEVLSSVGELYYPEHEYNKSDSYDKSNKATRDDAIQQIKDCFIADGWIEGYKGSDTYPTNAHYTPEQLKTISEELSKERLTGEEWLKKFEQDLMNIRTLWDRQPTEQEIIEAAKRASGVKR